MKYKHLSQDDRNELSILVKKGYSLRAIAQVLRRSPSSLSRELKRNKGRYDPREAQKRASHKKKYASWQYKKIRRYPWIEEYVLEKLQSGWSPEKIAGRLRIELGESVVSFKTIYNYLDSHWGWKYRKHLRHKKPWSKRLSKKKREHIKNRVFIEDRPEIVNRGKRFGDWEGDTMGKPRTGKETLVVLVDRKSRYLLAKKIKRLKLYQSQALSPLFRIDLSFPTGVRPLMPR